MEELGNVSSALICRGDIGIPVKLSIALLPSKVGKQLLPVKVNYGNRVFDHDADVRTFHWFAAC